jgi:hypothetical protein
MWKLMLLLFACFAAQAEQTSSKTKVDLYEGCMPSCISNQLTLPENKDFLDVKFILTAYCSCHCARAAMRLSAENVTKIGRAALSGQQFESLPELKQLREKNHNICVGALTSK